MKVAKWETAWRCGCLPLWWKLKELRKGTKLSLSPKATGSLRFLPTRGADRRWRRCAGCASSCHLDTSSIGKRRMPVAV